jgi:Adenylate and Guanylate cyclase catalytic domain
MLPTGKAGSLLMLLAASDAGQHASACWQSNSCCAPTPSQGGSFSRVVVWQLVVPAPPCGFAVDWRRWGHDIGLGIGIAHGFATLGTIGFEGRFDYAAIGTVSNVASRLCDEAKPGQILISPRVLTKVENAVKVEPVGEFELKGIRRPLAAYNVLGAVRGDGL